MSQLEARGSVEITRKWGPYPYYKDSGVEWLGEIPEHWSIKPIKRIFYILNGSTPKSNEPSYWSGSIPWATPDDLGSLETDTLKITKRMITQEGYESCGTKLAPTGSLVLSTRAPIGHLAIAGVPLCTNQGCRCLVFREKTQNRFYYYQLLAAKQELESWGQGSTFKELGRDKLVSASLVSPTLDEQHAITAFIDRETSRIDTLIAKKQRQIELLQKKRTALISHAVTKGLNPDTKMKASGIEWVGSIPSHWTTTKARFLYKQIFLEPSPSDEIVTAFRDGQVTSRQNRRTEGFTFAIKELGYQGIREGDLVIHSMDAFAGAIGVSESDGKCTGEYVICEPITKRTDNRYYASCLRWMAKQNYILAICPAVRERAPRFRFNRFKEALLPVPPYHEQRAIADHIANKTKNIDLLIFRIKRSIEYLQEYRTALISAAVTGKIDVRKEVA